MLLILIPAALVLLYLYLIAPRRRRPLGVLAQYDYAHRGLWNEDRPENSLPAFRAAAENGFGIELDVHLTTDGKLAVFHDDTLKRMCGDPRRVDACSLSELKALRLKDSDETIPSLEEVLAVIDSRVPLIVEVKTGPDLDILCAMIDTAMQAHRFAYCVESFDPRAVKWWRKHRPGVIRGQLALGMTRNVHPKKRILYFLASMMENVFGRPDFIAFDVMTDNSLPFRLVSRLYHPWRVAWTVRSARQMARLRDDWDLQIFEGFVPERRRNG